MSEVNNYFNQCDLIDINKISQKIPLNYSINNIINDESFQEKEQKEEKIYSYEVSLFLK